MKALPARSGFGETYVAGKPQVVWTTLVSDLETPVSAMIKLADGQSNCFLLESVTGGEVRGRYSFIGLKPDLDLALQPRQGRNQPARPRRCSAFEPSGEPPLQALRRCWRKAGSICRRNFRRWPPGCSAISATTWCG